MDKPARIRPLVLGLVFNNDRVLVSEGYDLVKQQTFYRALGGGVEFGETSVDALAREFQEEIQAELTNIQYLGFLENRFMYQGKPGHEWIQLYRCDFVDARLYEQEKICFVDGGSDVVAVWVHRDRFISGDLRLVPETCLQYL